MFIIAELSNDPLGELDSTVTYEINHKGTLHLANVAKAAGVKRFIYMSSCSVYGVAADGEVTEETKPNPQTAYAICKTFCERDLKELADKNFVPCYFRNATAFGASPRQRFDVLLNNLCGLAWTTKEIKMIIRRHTVASSHPRIGHRAGDFVRARCACRCYLQRDL